MLAGLRGLFGQYQLVVSSNPEAVDLALEHDFDFRAAGEQVLCSDRNAANRIRLWGLLSSHGCK